MNSNLEKAIQHLQAGEIIAYPTEAVYGLGCDPFNELTVIKLLQLKQREPSKGLILIASSWDQILPLIKPLKDEERILIEKTWPGPTTWVIPASAKAPAWIVGQHSTIALRLTAHPLARALCSYFGKPIVSTSANLSGHPPIRAYQEMKQAFPEVAYVLPGEVGDLVKPTCIRELVSGKIIRA